jgi:[ribosomal protein S5]-alanine N-acetyltransferase
MIETKRLLIKPLSYDELKKLIESPSCLAEDMGLISSNSLIDKEAGDAILNDLLPNLSDPEKDASFYTMWIVIEKSKKAIIGGICFHGEPDEKGEVEIGYGIDNGYMNKGYMTETIGGIINWIRNNKEVRIIKAETDSSNISSVRVLEKNGFELVQQNDNMIILKLELNKELFEKKRVLKQFQTIPGVGKACSLDFWNIGLRSISDLYGQNPRNLYDRLNTITGTTHDICMLYTFRCAVYFATENDHEKEKLKWWYWKDKLCNE